jgi:parvulin-like peptidyl-prolyl isomerase
LLTACHDPNKSDPPAAVAEEEVLARVGERKITLAEFTRELTRRARIHPQLYASEAQHRKLLEEMIQFEVLLASAKAAGYERDPQIQSQVNQFIVTRFQEDQLQKPGAIAPTEQELRAFYAGHPERFSVPPTVRAAVIQFKSSPKASAEKRDELRTRARTIWTAARTAEGAEFGRLVQQHSDDQSTRYHRGETGWITFEQLSERWNEPVSNAVFALTETGQTAPLVETPDGFYIVRLLEKRARSMRPFEEVRDAIAYAVTQQNELERQAEFRSRLRQNLKIESYPERLPLPNASARVVDPAPPTVPIN